MKSMISESKSTDPLSGTSIIKGYTFHYNGYNINLVDTPGFNDIYKSETEVLQDIATWVQESYEGEKRLNGIIYLHSLANVRMEGPALRNLNIFRQLCGEEALKNVILATTFWSEVAMEDALRREEQLRATPEFWGDMLEHGSIMKRLVDHNSALDIVGLLVEKSQITLQIQQELVEDQKKLVDTAAGQAVSEELVRLQQKYQQDLERVQRELHEALHERDQEMQDILSQQQKRLNRELEKVQKAQEQLRYDRRGKSEFELQNDHIRAEYEGLLKEDQQGREDLESKIGALSKELSENALAKTKLGEKALAKLKCSRKYLCRALQVILPITTMALIGVPISSPIKSGSRTRPIDKSFGGGGESEAEPAA